MSELSIEELKKIEGGAIKLAIGKVLLIGGATSFLIGLVNGYLRPLLCSSE